MSGKRIFGATTIAIALFAFWPAVIGGWQRVGALRDGVAQREDLLKQRRDILANLMKVNEEYRQQVAQEAGRNLLAIVPVKKDTAELVSALHAMAQQTGMGMNELQVTEGTSRRDAVAQTLNIGVELTGTYSAMRAFLDAVEREVRLLNVSTISVSEDPIEGLRFSIEAEAYFIE
ncbi:MAG TPA: type 4a pilus biogenesis protein PilO [Candidatus Paceibacterota bacterium]|nr:type 4a pilus biogenesis protein PilO [Candidatus Paceibacterota bacterium]